MSFYTYNESHASEFDQETQSQLATLMQRFGTVQMKEIVESKEWCIRIETSVGEDESLRLTALGDTPYEAAVRLLRMVQHREDDQTAF